VGKGHKRKGGRAGHQGRRTGSEKFLRRSIKKIKSKTKERRQREAGEGKKEPCETRGEVTRRGKLSPLRNVNKGTRKKGEKNYSKEVKTQKGKQRKKSERKLKKEKRSKHGVRKGQGLQGIGPQGEKLGKSLKVTSDWEG